LYLLATRDRNYKYKYFDFLFPFYCWELSCLLINSLIVIFFFLECRMLLIFLYSFASNSFILIYINFFLFITVFLIFSIYVIMDFIIFWPLYFQILFLFHSMSFSFWESSCRDRNFVCMPYNSYIFFSYSHTFFSLRSILFNVSWPIFHFITFLAVYYLLLIVSLKFYVKFECFIFDLKVSSYQMALPSYLMPLIDEVHLFSSW
jgi:hypothetical protein